MRDLATLTSLPSSKVPNDDHILSVQDVVSDGVNTAFRPNKIGPYQLSWASNVSVRDSSAKSRGNALIQRAVLPKGRVQGAGYFSRDGGQFIVSIWGQLHRILLNGPRATVDMIPLPWRNSAILPEVWMCETVGSFLVQDGQSACIVYDGSVANRSTTVPLGRQMAYGGGRLWLFDETGFNVLAGDITTDVFQSELQFTETQYLSGGGAFSFKKPGTALAFLPTNNTNTGFGSLIVAGRDFTNALRAEITSRDLWSQVPGFETVVLPTIGVAGQASVVGVNQDLYWRDANGQIWSLRSATSDAQGPGNSPISREVARITDFETDVQMPYSSAIYFDNRIIITASPFYNRFGAASFKKLIALDVAPTATMSGKGNPAYDGEWNGLNFVRLMQGDINGTKRAFAISTDDDGENRLWEFVPDATQDASYLSAGTGAGTGNGVVSLQASPITSYAEYRRFDFQAPARKKRLMRCDIFPTDLDGECNVQVYWRTDNRTQWILWDQFDVCATMTNADDQWLDLAQQERGRVKTLTAPSLNDSILHQAADVGYAFQIRLVWTGRLLVDRLTIWAKPLEETMYSELADLSPECVRNSIVNNEISYSIPVGGLGSPYTNEDGEIYVDQFNIPYTTPTTIL